MDNGTPDKVEYRDRQNQTAFDTTNWSVQQQGDAHSEIQNQMNPQSLSLYSPDFGTVNQSAHSNDIGVLHSVSSSTQSVLNNNINQAQTIEVDLDTSEEQVYEEEDYEITRYIEEQKYSIMERMSLNDDVRKAMLPVFEKLWEHIMMPRVKNRTGDAFHYYNMPYISGGHADILGINDQLDSTAFIGTSYPDGHGFYEGFVSVGGITAIKTMFPLTASPLEIFSMAMEAFINKVGVAGGIPHYIGVTEDGALIGFYMDSNGHVATFFPIYDAKFRNPLKSEAHENKEKPQKEDERKDAESRLGEKEDEEKRKE